VEPYAKLKNDLTEKLGTKKRKKQRGKRKVTSGMPGSLIKEIVLRTQPTICLCLTLKFCIRHACSVVWSHADDDSDAPGAVAAVVRKKTATDASKSSGLPALEIRMNTLRAGSYAARAAFAGLTYRTGLEEEGIAQYEQQQQQQQRGCLILFEGIDLLHEADRGFLSALSVIIEESKVSIITYLPCQ
jgi:hypothetical protein